VNQLSAVSSAVTVAVVLNVRKFASLLLSVVIFGSRLSKEAQIGAVLVTVGASWYAFETRGLKVVKGKQREELQLGREDTFGAVTVIGDGSRGRNGKSDITGKSEREMHSVGIRRR
jgi:hypothetical protein